jgi:hypothetical protein
VAQITITIHFRRWWRWYCIALVVINHVTGWRPSDDSIERVARHAIYVRHP